MKQSRALAAVGALAASTALGFLPSACGGSPPVPPPTPPPPTTTTTTTLAPSSLCDRLPPGNPNADCEEGATRLLPQVESAMETLIAERPQLFDLHDEHSPGGRAFRVVDHDGYMNGLVATLLAAGLCAERDVDDADQSQIFVKESNDYSEEFDVVLGSGHMRRGARCYRTTCAPAAFPAVPRPAEWPPLGSGCYRPFPPNTVDHMNCKVHIPGGEYATLDSTPYVRSPTYCETVGFPDRQDCPVRNEGASDRVACENWVCGNAADTGRPGPTWRKEDGSFCTGRESGCGNGATQYQLLAYRNGHFTVCCQTGTCCTVDVGEF